MSNAAKHHRQFNNRSGRAGGFGGCSECGDTWNWKDGHDTKFSEFQSCFPLCEECWQALTPQQRLPHYMKLVDKWEEYSGRMDQTRQRIREAVENGG